VRAWGAWEGVLPCVWLCTRRGGRICRRRGRPCCVKTLQHRATGRSALPRHRGLCLTAPRTPSRALAASPRLPRRGPPGQRAAARGCRSLSSRRLQASTRMAAGAVFNARLSRGSRRRVRRQGRVVRLGALQATSADAQAFHIDRLAGDQDADVAAAGADARKASGE